MKVKLFDCENELDLEDNINKFLNGSVTLFDIKYQVSSFVDGDNQIYCFSALLIYKDNN